MNRNLTISILLAALAIMLSGCEPRYANFGEELDVIDPIDGDVVTFIRTTTSGQTTLLTIEDPDQAGGGQIIITLIEPTTETVMYTGTYAPNGDDEIHATFHTVFYFPFQPTIPVVGRDGSTREDVHLEQNFGYEYVGDRLIMTAGDQTWVLQTLDDVVETLDLGTQTGAENFAQVYNLTVLSNQVRIIGFGSAGMFNYISNPGTFVGLVEGSMSVGVASAFNPTATMLYTGFEDMHPMIYDGDIITRSDASGNGPMEGVVSFQYASLTGPNIDGDCDYANLIVSRGMAGGGYYVFTLPTGQWDVDWTVLANMDLTSFIPPTP